MEYAIVVVTKDPDFFSMEQVSITEKPVDGTSPHGDGLSVETVASIMDILDEEGSLAYPPDIVIFDLDSISSFLDDAMPTVAEPPDELSNNLLLGLYEHIPKITEYALITTCGSEARQSAETLEVMTPHFLKSKGVNLMLDHVYEFLKLTEENALALDIPPNNSLH
ncbi:MAG: hypothetical protein ACRBCT_08845 [Alphaproteobacteria bacterium]